MIKLIQFVSINDNGDTEVFVNPEKIVLLKSLVNPEKGLKTKIVFEKDVFVNVKETKYEIVERLQMLS